MEGIGHFKGRHTFTCNCSIIMLDVTFRNIGNLVEWHERWEIIGLDWSPGGFILKGVVELRLVCQPDL